MHTLHSFPLVANPGTRNTDTTEVLVRFFALSLITIVISACNEFPHTPSNTYAYCADTGPDPFTIEGTITYNQTVQPGTQVFLVNSGETLIDQATSDYAGYYSFETTTADTYTLLAGYEAATPLMATATITLDESQIDNIVYMELSLVDTTEESASYNAVTTAADPCGCDVEVWNFVFVCCDIGDEEMGDPECAWQWGECSE